WSRAREAPRTLLTGAAAAVLGSHATEPADVDGYFVVGAQKAWMSEATPPSAPSLRGREAVIASLVASAERCRAGAAATLTTIVGDPGVGKSRLLDAISAELRGHDFQVLRFDALSPERGSADSLTSSLLRALFDLGAGASAVDVRARCGAALGADGAAVWPAVALALGVLDPSAPEAAATLRAVGAARQSVALAIGSGLRRLAATRPLALLVDDLQWADASALDSLELATARPGPLWVCVATRPALLSARPGWGDRAVERDTSTLEPIAPAAAAALIRELLRPVEFLPDAIVAQLIERTGAVPLYLVELCQVLRRGGAVRRHPDSNAWYLAPDELLHATPVSLQEQLAARVLGTLPPSLVALAQLCSVVGDGFDAAEIEATVAALERGCDEFAIGIDAATGLRQLARGHILAREGQRYRFANTVLRRSIEAGTTAVVRRRLHRACLDVLHASERGDAGRQLRLARHQIACDETAAAAAVYRGLADEARILQRWVDAEQYYSTALELVAADAPSRLDLFANRGRVRYRLGLLRESVDDLQRARQLAAALGDERTVADVMLEEATVHDWLEDYSRSAELAAELEGPITRLGDPVLTARWSLARARALFRRGFETRAIEPLRRALAQADAVGDYDTQIVCYLLLPYALLQAGRVGESEELAAAAIELCERAGDRVHLGVAHLNRIYLWMCLGNKERALDDYRIAVRLAHEFGLAKIVSHASQIHCEILYYFGELDAAAALARQVIALDESYRNPNADLLILAARVLCASGEHAEAERLCASLSAAELRNATCQARFLLQLVQRYLAAARSTAEDAGAWLALLDDMPEHMLVNENVEAFYWILAGLARTGGPAAALVAIDERARKA
ncbi:MAG TPA: AAA family ATPase, partial [Polyangia bacterium]